MLLDLHVTLSYVLEKILRLSVMSHQSHGSCDELPKPVTQLGMIHGDSSWCKYISSKPATKEHWNSGTDSLWPTLPAVSNLYRKRNQNVLPSPPPPRAAQVLASLANRRAGNSVQLWPHSFRRLPPSLVGRLKPVVLSRAIRCARMEGEASGTIPSLRNN